MVGSSKADWESERNQHMMQLVGDLAHYTNEIGFLTCQSMVIHLLCTSDCWNWSPTNALLLHGWSTYHTGLRVWASVLVSCKLVEFYAYVKGVSADAHEISTWVADIHFMLLLLSKYSNVCLPLPFFLMYKAIRDDHSYTFLASLVHHMEPIRIIIYKRIKKKKYIEQKYAAKT